MKILFHHIPKCAGTSFVINAKNICNYKVYRFCGNNVLKEFNKNNLKLEPKDCKKFLLEIQEFKRAEYEVLTSWEINEDLLKQDNIIIYSHEFENNFDNLLQDPVWLKVTGVRNPFSRFFSLVNQKQRNNAFSSEDFILDGDWLMFNFFYNQWSTDQEKLPLTKQNAPQILTKAIEYLNLFDVIFTQENFEEFFKKLFRLQNTSIKQENFSKKNSEVRLNYQLVSRYSEYVEFEKKFYDLAAEKGFKF